MQREIRNIQTGVLVLFEIEGDKVFEIGLGSLKTRMVLFVSIVVLGCSLQAVDTWGAAVYSDKVVAVVNNDVILESDIAKHKQPFMRNIFNLPLGIVPPGKWPTEKEILDELIVIKLLEQEATKKGVNLDEKAVEASIDSIRKRNNLTQDQFVLFLAANNLSYQDYKKIMTRQFRLTRLIENEVTRKVPISEEDAQKYFRDHRNDIEREYTNLLESLMPTKQQDEPVKPNIPTHEEIYQGGKIRLRQITLKIPSDAKAKDAQKIMDTAKRIFEESAAGSDFGKLAKKYSQDPWAKNGGDLGLMDYKEMVPGLQKMVQRMKPGDMTPPIKTKEAVVLFYLDEAKGRQTKRVPIPEKTRKELEKRWQQALDARDKAQTKRQEQQIQETEGPRANPPDVQSSKPGGETSRSIGILSPEDTKDYEKVRNKVAAIVRHDKIQTRMKEWINELRRNSIIDVKI